MSWIRRTALDWLPPALLRAARRLAGSGLRFDVGHASWEAAAESSRGYASGDILERVLESTLRVINGQAPSCRDGVCLERSEPAWPVLTGLLRAAARAGGELAVLDFGGALGGSYLGCRSMLAGLHRLQWVVVEQPRFVECGRRRIAVEGLQFAETVAEATALVQPDVILLSSVLQYLQRPYDVLRELADTCAGTMIIDRTPVGCLDQDLVLVQRAPARVSDESYPAWVFAEGRLRAELEANWSICSTFACPEGAMRLRRGLRFEYQGMLLERSR